MSLGKGAFVDFRRKVLEAREKRLLEGANANILTASHIADVLSKSNMVAGNLRLLKLH